jgi:CDP-glycerol glycerophosphotransferase (TagB/SpsB family)
MYKVKFIIKISLPFSSYKAELYRVDIKYDDFKDSAIHSRIVAIFKDKNGFGFYKRIKYNFLTGDKTNYNSSSIKIIKNTNSSIYVRQSSNNSVFITNRASNRTDKRSAKIKIWLARKTSYLMPFKHVTLMYEKESYKYEESASVLYERLIDLNYKNIYYVLDKESKHVSNVKGKYKRNILFKNSFRHYLYFFRTNTFIGTEVPAHAIDLRISNKYAEKKLAQKKYKYVFLQHGVMYMVSLGSSTRKAFRKGEIMPINTKIVVSSKEEANHFIDYGNYDENDLYITGLPKFDRNIKKREADKIVVMPTWRPWEYNEIRNNFRDTGYYKMLIDIINSVPDKLKDKLIVLPHPLFLEYINDPEMMRYMPEINSYDEVLQDTALLITDYSSIAYDAFYRGTNVIFWWKDKQECMDQYGGFLMLNENNIFGDICSSIDELKKSIVSRYKQSLPKKYINNYRKLVEFNDNKNTDRLVSMLIKDKIIK